MNEEKYDPKKPRILNYSQRLKDIPPDYVWDILSMEKADVIVETGAGAAFFCIG